MGPDYKEFNYYEDPAIASRFFTQKDDFWLTSMFEKFGYNKCHL